MYLFGKEKIFELQENLLEHFREYKVKGNHFIIFDRGEAFHANVANLKHDEFVKLAPEKMKERFYEASKLGKDTYVDLTKVKKHELQNIVNWIKECGHPIVVKYPNNKTQDLIALFNDYIYLIPLFKYSLGLDNLSETDKNKVLKINHYEVKEMIDYSHVCETELSYDDFKCCYAYLGLGRENFSIKSFINDMGLELSDGMLRNYSKTLLNQIFTNHLNFYSVCFKENVVRTSNLNKELLIVLKDINDTLGDNEFWKEVKTAKIDIEKSNSKIANVADVAIYSYIDNFVEKKDQEKIFEFCEISLEKANIFNDLKDNPVVYENGKILINIGLLVTQDKEYRSELLGKGGSAECLIDILSGIIKVKLENGENTISLEKCEIEDLMELNAPKGNRDEALAFIEYSLELGKKILASMGDQSVVKIENIKSFMRAEELMGVLKEDNKNIKPAFGKMKI